MPADTLSTRQLLTFSLPAAGLATLLFFVQFFFLKYGTEVLMISPAIIGAMLGAAKLWDAISDPLVGRWSDRTRGPRGRRHPWMWGGLPVIALGFVAIWAVPAGLDQSAKIVLVMTALFVFYTGFTLHSVPHTAFGVELSRDSHQRVRAFGLRQVFWTFGLFASFALLQLASGSAQAAVFLLSAAIAVVGVALCAITPALMPPRATDEPSEDEGFAASYRAVLGQRGAVILFLVWFIENLGAGVLGGLTPFYADYVLGRPDLLGALPATYAAAGILSMPVWIRASRRFGKQPTWIVAMLLGATGFAITYASAMSIWIMLAGLVLAGSAMGCGGMMAVAVMADLVDEQETQTGHRYEGTFTALLNISLKGGIALSTALGGVMLGAVGFVANQAQSPEAIEGIRLFFAFFPAAGFLVGAALFALFPGRDAQPARSHTRGARGSAA